MILTEFLLARITEDEWTAQQVVDPLAVDKMDLHTVSLGEDPSRRGVWVHPARVLAECEAKRRIVELYEGLLFEMWADRTTTHAGVVKASQIRVGISERVLEFMATPYAGHPDFNEDWRTCEGT